MPNATPAALAEHFRSLKWAHPDAEDEAQQARWLGIGTASEGKKS
jgi:hypothetical protein